MSQKSLKKIAKLEQEANNAAVPDRNRMETTPTVNQPNYASDLAGRPIKQHEYVHLRDKPDFYEQIPNQGKAQCLYKKLHDIPFAAKVEDAFRIKLGRKQITEQRAQQDVPLKIGAYPLREDVKKGYGKKQIPHFNLPCKREDRGKKILRKPNEETCRSESARRAKDPKSVPRETLEYMKLQFEKQNNYDHEVDREAAYRRKTPERRNAEVMDSIMSYKFVKYPADKLTDKVNRIEVPDAKERSLSTRRSSSYYGKRCR